MIDKFKFLHQYTCKEAVEGEADLAPHLEKTQ